MSSRRRSLFRAAVTCLACATGVAAHAEQVVVLKDGIAALKLSSPGPQNLASGAALNLQLPSATMNAQATASVGQSDAPGGFWHKDAAQVDAKVQGPLGSSVSATGEHQLSFDYRAPAGASAPTTADHLVRSENQNGNLTVTIPVEGAEVTVGGERSGTLSQDMTGSQANSPIVGTQDHAAFARIEWQPLPGLHVEGGAAARTANVTWRSLTSRSSSYRSVDPHVSVSVTPWQDADVSAAIEHVVSPYDTAAFASYSADEPRNAPALEPDHSWQLQTRFEQRLGDAKLSASYTASRDGSATELAQGAGGVQTPASTPLLSRENVALNLNLPLADIGLSGTELSSQAQWQTSRVIDPLTHDARAASGEVPRKYSLRLSHSFGGERLRLGLTGDFTGARTSYQVREVTTTDSGGSIGAFVSYAPGPYQVDLSVSGLCGSSTTETVFRDTRLDPQFDHITSQPNSGPLLSLSLHKPL